jgi:hypothetical protein
LDRVCLQCDRTIWGWDRPDKIFCSKACKQKYYRDSRVPMTDDELVAVLDALFAESTDT